MLDAVTTTRDPVSVLFDRGAAELLAQARRKGRKAWVGTRLGDPGPQTRLWLASMGVDWRGPDNPAVPNPNGGLDCKDRWTRAFVRALYYQHTRYSKPAGGRRLVGQRADALQVDIGRRLPPLGIFPSGRAVRIRLLQGGRAAYQAAAKRSEDDRIFGPDGEPTGGRAQDLRLRDYLCRESACTTTSATGSGTSSPRPPRPTGHARTNAARAATRTRPTCPSGSTGRFCAGWAPTSSNAS